VKLVVGWSGRGVGRAAASVAERYGFEEDLEDDTDLEVDPPGGNGLHPA
jgi:hypothetical protein